MAQKHTKQKPQSTDHPPEQVVLKPIWGVHPGHYVTGILAGMALLIFFLLLIYPGLSSDRRTVHIDSTPPNAAVYHNDTRLGATPDTFALPTGSTEITLKRPHFQDTNVTVEVPQRWFATLFFPPRASETVRMHADEHAGEQVLESAGDELTRWAALGESTQTRPVPPILTNAALDAIALEEQRGAPEDASDPTKISEFLLSSAQNVTSSAILRDLTYAGWAVTSEADGNPAPGALSAGELVQYIIHLENNSEGLLTWLASLESSPLTSRIEDFDGTEQEIADTEALENDYAERLAEELDGSGRTTAAENDGPFSQVTIAGMDFIRIPEGEVLLGFSEGLAEGDSEMFRVLRRTDEFYIARTPVTVELWTEFLEEHPEWRDDNRDELIAEGVADSDYLRGLNRQSADEPVTYVSWYAASAFAEWMSARAGNDFHVALPSEEQWARAAALDSFNVDLSERAFDYGTGVRSVGGQDERSGRTGVVDLVGNVWEWTSTPHYMADTSLRVSADTTLFSAGRSGYAVVRGGSWANEAERIGFESRGGQQKRWSTPFLGFRLVAEEGGQ